MSKLMIDWQTVATAGPTIDGRTLEALQMEEMAYGYNPAEYTAVVNVDHVYGNMGHVTELRTSRDAKVRTVLQARIQPNSNYVYLNESKVKQFFSIELVSDFAKTGKAYLVGLAITDVPASLGTSKAEFKAGGRELLSTNEPADFDFQTFPVCSDTPVLNFLKRLFSFTPSQKELTMSTPAEQNQTALSTPSASPRGIEVLSCDLITETVKSAVTAAFAERQSAETVAELTALKAEKEALKTELTALKESAAATIVPPNTGATESVTPLY